MGIHEADNIAIEGAMDDYETVMFTDLPAGSYQLEILPYYGYENLDINTDSMKVTYDTFVDINGATESDYAVTNISDGESYRVRISLGGYTVSREYTYSMPAELTITGVAAQDTLYSGGAAAGYTGTPAADGYDGEIAAVYQKKDGTAYVDIEGAPTDPGEYRVVFMIAPTSTAYGYTALNFEITTEEKQPDGSTITSKPTEDGSIVVTKTDADGNIIEETVTAADGSSIKTEYDTEDGSKIVTEADADGNIISKTTIFSDGSYIKDGFTPVLTHGDGAVYKQDGSTLTFVSDDEFINFLRVLVDGAELSPDNYTVESGSIRVTLNESYLGGLDAGDHTIAIVSTNGTASGTFTVEEVSASEDPSGPANGDKDENGDKIETGDGNSLALWITLMFTGISGLVIMGIICSRNRKAAK